MRVRSSVHLSFLCVLFLSVAASAQPATKSFREEKLGLTYAYPASFQDKGAQKIGCVTIALDGRHNTETDHDMLTLMEVDFSCLGETGNRESLERSVMVTFRKSMNSYGATPKIGDLQRYELNGYAADYIEVSSDAPAVKAGMRLYSGSSCFVKGQTAFCWSIQCNDEVRMHKLLRNPVVFDGKPEIAVVPEALFGK